MSSHGPHPLILVHGLADGCERCLQIAADPFAGLDPDNLETLVERTRSWLGNDEEGWPRSDAECVAMREIEKAITRAYQLAAMGVLA